MDFQLLRVPNLSYLPMRVPPWLASDSQVQSIELFKGEDYELHKFDIKVIPIRFFVRPFVQGCPYVVMEFARGVGDFRQMGRLVQTGVGWLTPEFAPCEASRMGTLIFGAP